MSNSSTNPASRKPVFDGIRRLLGRGFRQSEVDALDDAFDDALGTGQSSADGASVFSSQDSVPSVPSVPHIRRTVGRSGRTIGPRGIALIKRFAGCARLRRDGLVEAYPDPGTGGEPWTIGWGATGPGLELGSRIGPDTVWTQAQCDERFASDLKQYARDVARAIGDAPTSEAQFDALVSFHYNTGAIHRATLTRKHKEGDFAGAAREFARWNKAGGRVLKGLVNRRREEANLYASGQ